MAWVRFTEDFDFIPPDAPRVMIAYKAGKTYNVPRACADQAVIAGKARRTKPVRKPGNGRRSQS